LGIVAYCHASIISTIIPATAIPVCSSNHIAIAAMENAFNNYWKLKAIELLGM